MNKVISTLLLLFLFLPLTPFAQSLDNPEADTETIERFISEGIDNSQVMEIASWMTDVYGPRLTNSPQMRHAANFAKTRMRDIGLENSHFHQWGPFGKGWELNRFSMHAQSEYSYFPVIGYPKAWSSGHDGLVSGEVIFLEIESKEDIEKYRGRVSGKFVMLDLPAEPEPAWDPIATRRSDSNLLELANRGDRPQQQWGGPSEAAQERARLQYAIQKFLQEEQPLALLDYGYRGWYGQIAVTAAGLPVEPGTSWWDRPRVYETDPAEIVPQVSLVREHYGRIYRMLKKDVPVHLEMELDVTFHDEDLYGYNVIAEIPGTDPDLKDEIVMLGAHFDSWHAATGATDNAAGSAVMLEAMRILKETGVEPRRTIRVALWDGEEQGLHGSREYVSDHFAEQVSENGETVLHKKDDYDNFSAYFNLDNGTGQIRGIFLQENEPLRPLSRSWLQPFADWDATTVTYGNTGSTDHVSFDRVGLPGFQFIQDPIEYFTMTHHSNQDYYERLVPEDMKRNAVIVATFVYHTAMLDQVLPRKD